MTERAEPAPVLRLPGIDNRERALPIRQGDLSRLLLAEPGLSDEDRKLLEEFGRILGATFHSEFFGKLRELKELYAPLDPDADYVTLEGHTRPRNERSDEEFLVPFEATLEQANYRELDLQVIEAGRLGAQRERADLHPGLQPLRAPEDLRARLYADHADVSERKDQVPEADRPSGRLPAADHRVEVQARHEARPVRPLRRRLPADVQGRAARRHGDAPARAGDEGPDALDRQGPDRLAAGRGPPHPGVQDLRARLRDRLAPPMTLGTLMIAPISAGANSFFGFQRAKQRHLSHMIRSLYYLTLANNASVLTRLIDSAEDEEYKEAMLAYFFLWRAIDDPEPWDTHQARRPDRVVPGGEDGHRDQLRGRRRPRQALPPRPRLARPPGPPPRQSPPEGPQGPRPDLGQHLPLLSPVAAIASGCPLFNKV